MTDLKGPNMKCANCLGAGQVVGVAGRIAVCPNCEGTGVVPVSSSDGPTSPKELTNERKSTHGDWTKQSKLFMRIVAAMEGSANYSTLEAYQKAALLNIAQKMSRILTGNAGEPDHWDDIGGYALLGKGGHAE